MVKIESVEELNRIKKSNYGFVITLDEHSKAVMHKTNCDFLTEENYLNGKKTDDVTKFHWHSTFSLAEKEFPKITSCNICNL